VFAVLLAFLASPGDYAAVKAILTRNCVGCHGAKLASNGLRLDGGQEALRGSYAGAVIVPGDAAASKLIAMVEGGKMPPAGRKLTRAETSALRAWIDAGARFPEEQGAAAARPSTGHWSFRPLRKPAVPAVAAADRDWVRTPVDAFILARLRREKIEPSPEAPRSTLLRRVTLDLTGLPPTPEEIDAFLADTGAGAYERVVERLLRSPHYGEKWARHWLDLARYADSDGYETDRGRPYAWRYRQYVIDAFNRDLPFDRFTIEQLAGDLLPNPTADQRAAAGFYRNSLTNREGGVDTEEFRIAQVMDRTATVGTVWLGLTVGCAQCHDHKYDPISQRDYYSLFAFFNQLMDHDVESPLPGETGPWLARRPAHEISRREMFASYGGPALMKEWREIMLKAAAEPGHNEKFQFAWKFLGNLGNGLQPVLMVEEHERPREQQEQLIDYFVERAGDVFDKERLELLNWDSLRKEWSRLNADGPKVSMAQSVRQAFRPRRTHVLLRGDFRTPGVEVTPATPAALHPFRGEPTRLNLARWLVSPENPLTARVIVNRVWQEYFGRGIVFTSEDFGARGEKPSHPELLDWLAVEFMDKGWSFRNLHRTIVLSSAYRQSSKARHDLKDRDPDNTLLARQTRLRLPAELIRDSALAASGLLAPKIGGPSVRPPQPAGLTDLSYASNVKWVESQGPDRYRRGLYVFFQRTVPYPQLMNFDAPDGVQACSRRQRSSTPLQALNLLNDPVFFEAAQALGARLLAEAPPQDGARLRLAWRLCLGRDPDDRESESMGRHLARLKAELASRPGEAGFLDPQSGMAGGAAEGAVWTVASRVLLNLDEFLHRE